jgi:pimeloyl-ACP methyl ester carboxylesterase
MDEKYLVVSEEPFIQLRHIFFTSLERKYENRTIIMIIGWLDYIERKRYLIESFRKIANIIIYEPRGFGKSTTIEKKGLYGIEECTKDFAKLINHYRLEDRNFYIWASSFGCSIALNYSVENIGPQPEAFFLVSPEAKTQSRWWFHIVKHFPRFLYPPTVKVILFFLNFFIRRKNPKDVQRVSDAVEEFKRTGFYCQIRVFFECLDRFDIRGSEEKIGAPMLVFIAKKDWFSDPENSIKLSKIHPNSEVICLGDSHRNIVEHKDELTKYIHEYIEGLNDQ